MGGEAFWLFLQLLLFGTIEMATAAAQQQEQQELQQEQQQEELQVEWPTDGSHVAVTRARLKAIYGS